MEGVYPVGQGWRPPRLAGHVVLVAGATRGAGRAIAWAFGEAGATVYCTGRSSRRSVMKGRPETIEETARGVRERGGVGIALRVDHTEPRQVARLMRRIEKDHGRLDVLINDVWGGDELTKWGMPFWEHPLENALEMIRRGLLTHLVTAHEMLPLLLRSKHPRLIELTDGDEKTNQHYRGSLYYDLVKSAIIRTTHGMSKDLANSKVVAIGVSPGFMRSEAVLDHFGVREENWRDAVAKDKYFQHSETPALVARGIVHLAADAKARRWAGRTLGSWDLATEYDYDDQDGRRPHWGRVAETLFS